MINTQSQSPARYYQGQNYSTSSVSASGNPMDIGAADASSQQRGKGPQCYNCQLIGHIACECTKPRCPCRGQPQARAAQTQPEDDRLNAVRGMSFAEIKAFFRDLKDWRVRTYQALSLSNLLWTQLYVFWTIDYLALLLLLYRKYLNTASLCYVVKLRKPTQKCLL